MKRFLIILPAVLLFVAMPFFIGCSDDDEDTVINSIPGDLNDPNLAMFLEEFEGMDDLTEEMFSTATGLFMDSIIRSAAKPKTITGPLFLITYHEDSKFWYCEAENYDPTDSMTFFYIDSIQFMHGDNIVQWPNPELLTSVSSYLTLHASGPHVDTAIAHQDMVVTIAVPGSDTLTINGTQDFMASYEFTDIDLNDTTVCQVDIDYDMSIDDLEVAMAGETNGPHAGTITYTGTMNMECTGADAGSISGSWTVVQTFTPEGSTLVITHNNTIWTVIDW